MQSLVIQEIRLELENTIVNFVDFLPSVIAAAAIVFIGLFAGGKLQPAVTRIGRRVELDEKVRKTPFGSLFPDDSDAVSSAFAVVGKYYVALLAAFVAAEWLGFQSIRTWIEGALSYVPWLAAGAGILLVGFFLADHLGEQARRSEAVQELGFPAVFGGLTKVVLYFVVTVMGLELMGVDVTVLYMFAEAFAWGAGIAVALAIGIAFGWGGKDYVADNLDSWLEDSTPTASSSTPAADDD